jgi:hypothetical protein
MRYLLLGCVLAGCGRLGFSDRMAAPDAAVDARRDAVDARVVPLCPLNVSVPDPITVTGETFEYTGFNNTTTPTPSVTVTAYVAGSVVATTVSDAQGMYSMAIPTSGTQQLVEIDYAPSGYWITQVLPNRAVDGAVTGPNTMFWRLGDGPVWADGQMGSVYGSAALSYDLAKGTLEIAARDCAGTPLAGVVFTVTPAPEKLIYLNSGGGPDTSLTATDAMYGHAVGFNAVPGPTHITATKDGVDIYTIDLDVPAGRFNTYPVFYIP